MKELAHSFAQLIAIILITITIAVWTAALSLWASSSAATQGEQTAPAPATLVSDVASTSR